MVRIKSLGIVALFMMLFATATSFAQPKSEIRAVWLTTNGSLDYPKNGYTESSQKTELVEILDKLQKANFNTIIFQVQVKGDVLWDSKIQPALRTFTGDGSKKLHWNVCDYIIEECHKRDMECHAWIVPYRVGTASEASKYANNEVTKHVSVLHPEWCVTYSNAKYLNPGLPEVREYLVELYRELLTTHDFDGVNFDYTRYPGSDFADDDAYAQYGNGMTLDDWRRENINTFIGEFYDMAKSVNPRVKVGAAPFGTYKNADGYHNSTAYGSVYQDAAEWMRRGKHDLLVPQMYWNEKNGFTPHMQVWVDNCDGRQIVVGLAPYKMVDGSNNWAVSEITGQIEKTRANEGISGVCFFRTDHVIGTETKVADLYEDLVDTYFKYPAHIVPMDYNGITKPNVPANVQYTRSGNTYNVTWDAATTTFADAPVKYYCVYASTEANVDISDVKNCVGFAVKGTDFTFTSSDDLNIVVTAFDENYYESDVAQALGVEDALADVPTKVYAQAGQIIVEGLEGSVKVEVFNIDGRKVYDGTDTRIELQTKGIYVVRVSGKSYKVVL